MPEQHKHQLSDKTLYVCSIRLKTSALVQEQCSLGLVQLWYDTSIALIITKKMMEVQHCLQPCT